MKLPRIWAECETCHCESSAHPPECVAWSSNAKLWLCSDCWGDDERTENERPVVFAKDALEETQDMRRRMIAAATARRLGV